MNQKNNLAYDYARFEERDRSQIQEVKKSPAPKKRIGAVRAVCYMAMIGIMLGMLVYPRVVQTNLNDEYIKTMASISEMKGENARLQLLMESQLSTDNIEQIARSEYGMESLNNQQVEYISFETQNKVEIVEQNNFWENIGGWLKGLFH